MPSELYRSWKEGATVRRRAVLVFTVGMSLAGALLLVAVTHAASTSSPSSAGIGFADLSASAALWSRWDVIPPGQCRVYAHNLGGDPK